MDLGIFGSITLDAKFFSALLSIVIIDIILAGDNAVVIAMAVRSLPPEQRKKGILFGSGAAVLLRVVLTFFVAQMLRISFIKLVGGILIIWIAIKLFMEGAHDQEDGKESGSLPLSRRVFQESSPGNRSTERPPDGCWKRQTVSAHALSIRSTANPGMTQPSMI